MSQDSSALTVSVVIPTVNRPDLVRRAVDSALGQTHAPHEVIVVSDGGPDEGLERLRELSEPTLKTIRLERSASDAAATARNTGIRAATGAFVALLDDDDEWLPHKLAGQLKVFLERQTCAPAVVSCQVERRTPDGVAIWPKRMVRPSEKVADYLFIRSEPGEGWLPTPSLLLPRDLALAVPFQTGMKQHEDIDWMLRLEAAGAEFVVVMETLAVVHVGESATSLSAQAHWRHSLEWANERQQALGPQAYSAFCLTEVSRTARDTRSLQAFGAIIRSALRGAPRRRDIAQFLASWLVPRAVWPLINRLRESARSSRVR